jgi:hypothetical protein
MLSLPVLPEEYGARANTSISKAIYAAAIIRALLFPILMPGGFAYMSLT